MESGAIGGLGRRGIGAMPPPREGRKVYWVIDRFEGGQAVCENDARQTRDVPRGQLPPGVRDGDVLVAEGDRFRFDEAETKRRRQAVKDAAKDLWA